MQFLHIRCANMQKFEVCRKCDYLYLLKLHQRAACLCFLNVVLRRSVYYLLAVVADLPSGVISSVNDIEFHPLGVYLA